ncbi:MAG: cytochrome c oxidase assembly protein [Rhodospirillales bacterium]|nr:cytochrome c oxidase assembly protein [Rhodospirillales bacterium]
MNTSHQTATVSSKDGATPPAPRTRRRRNVAVVAALTGILGAMGTLVYFAVPLYQLFCQVTGFGGTTQVAAKAPGAVPGRVVTVRFDTNVARDMPWQFSPPAPVEVRLGEERLVAFAAQNTGNEPMLGTATFNVTPFKVARYFNKIECFCFTEQLLMPGERKEFPVTFFVDPAIADDPNAGDVTAITLSYTFYNKGAAALDEYLNRSRATAGRAVPREMNQ